MNRLILFSFLKALGRLIKLAWFGCVRHYEGEDIYLSDNTLGIFALPLGRIALWYYNKPN